MAFLDFMKNRNAGRQQPAGDSQQPKPGVVKEMYAERDAQQKAAEKPITPEVKEQADRAMAAMNKATQHQDGPAAPSPSEGSSNSAQLQKQNHQDKGQAALSPTDDASGKTAGQEKQPAPEKTPEAGTANNRASSAVLGALAGAGHVAPDFFFDGVQFFARLAHRVGRHGTAFVVRQMFPPIEESAHTGDPIESLPVRGPRRKRLQQ